MKKKVIMWMSGVMLAISFIGCGSSTDADIKEENTEYLSQTESIDEETENTEITEDTKTIVPLPSDVDVNKLENCTIAVSLEEGDVYVDDTGALQMHVKVYSYDKYDMVDISLLEEGDKIMMNQEEVQIESLERTESGLVLINGGLDENGHELMTRDDGVYFESGYSDKKSYYEVGEATIRVSADFEFIDSSDLEKGEVTYYPGDFLTLDAGILYYFTPDNTSILIEDGIVTAMYRVYTP